jgi:hypothetical protein
MDPFRILQSLESGLYNRTLRSYMILRERLSPRQGLRILFSPKPDWEGQIRAGFRHTRHEVAFLELSPLKEAIADYDVVVPLTIADVRFLNKTRGLIAHNRLPIPSLESISLCDDKVRFSQFLQDNGFGDFLPQTGDRLAYPYVVKKRIDEYGQSCHMIHDARGAEACAGFLADPAYFTQALVPGPKEYATHIVFSGGKIACSLNIEYRFGTSGSIKGKDNYLGTHPCRCPHLDLFASMLKAIEFEGLCCVNYKTADDGRPMMLEINPRFGGSLSPWFFGFIRYLR